MEFRRVLFRSGRGVARRDTGKAVFIAGALPGERVMAKQTARSRSFDEAVTLEVLDASPDRVDPRCPHFGTCGGCALQHLAESKQILAKQRVLLENLERIGHVRSEEHTSELQSILRLSYAAFCLKKTNKISS